MDAFDQARRRLALAQEYGFGFTDEQTFPDHFHPWRGAHDDGSFCGLSLGGIGAGNFGRDLHGHFSRWHLQNGYHRRQVVDAANISLRWAQDDRAEGYRLGTVGWDRPLPPGVRTVHTLFPVTFEHLSSADWPVEAVVESYSPLIPRDHAASCLPVAFFDVTVRNVTDAPARFDMAFFWPNVLGWRPSTFTQNPQAPAVVYDDTPRERYPVTWPDRSNAGNVTRATEPDGEAGLLEGILYERRPRREPRHDMEGEWMLGLAGGDGLRHSKHVCYRCSRQRGKHSANDWFQAAVEDRFFATGGLADSLFSWRTTYFEVCGGAVAGGMELAPGESGTLTFVLAWDMPLSEAGSGRTWAKAYTAQVGCDGTHARELGARALAARDEWRRQIDDWQRDMLQGRALRVADPRVKGAVLNELYFLLDGGSFWVAGQHDAAGLPEPCLGAGPHYSVLEGFDIGYYYCTTFDLYPHAALPFVLLWPQLGSLLLHDFYAAAPLELDDERICYKLSQRCLRLEANKVPHDIGAPPGDPWHVLNDYNLNLDSNRWKDHNPMFLVAVALHTALTRGRPPSTDEWRILQAVAAHMEAQDKDGDGLPEHDTFGDNTWDGVEMSGPAIFSSSLTLAALAAMAELARQVEDEPAQVHYAGRANTAAASFEHHFWNGRYYSNATAGARRDWVFADGLLGILLAKVAGLGDLLPYDHVHGHMRAVYEHNYKGLADGRYGPSLQAPPHGWEGEETGVQIDEVLVGSAWSCVGLMLRYGLEDEAEEIARTLAGLLYGESGLHFRTPAAWTSNRNYRAPLNMRPLAIWYLCDERSWE